MRDNVHQSRNRIVRYFGVLVAAALVAALGLPTAAQAQTPAAPMVSAGETGTGEVGSPAAALSVSWGQAFASGSDQDQWLIEYTEPGVAWAMRRR